MLELTRMFPDEAAATKWFEDIVWPNGLQRCPACDSVNVYKCKHKKMPYR